jgi:hypothetical protein
MMVPTGHPWEQDLTNIAGQSTNTTVMLLQEATLHPQEEFLLIRSQGGTVLPGVRWDLGLTHKELMSTLNQLLFGMEDSLPEELIHRLKEIQ